MDKFEPVSGDRDTDHTAEPFGQSFESHRDGAMALKVTEHALGYARSSRGGLIGWK
ncbi:hypothetical protein M2336_000282 [Sphingobium sp. B1D7B]|uniref:hypothetical protein n=1 Tax=unclassified Sphingobium TaxID=2611147 RepID=UPI002224F659|nr:MULTISPECIES: hypothetical protein [unclassified Sphingobium]MCW2403653.1 hypothetical protein [Sphingobium sp. B1D7B]